MDALEIEDQNDKESNDKVTHDAKLADKRNKYERCYQGENVSI